MSVRMFLKDLEMARQVAREGGRERWGDAPSS
jgi:hypothetical protein